jgi:hypothetical protein
VLPQSKNTQLSKKKSLRKNQERLNQMNEIGSSEGDFGQEISNLNKPSFTSLNEPTVLEKPESNHIVSSFINSLKS